MPILKFENNLILYIHVPKTGGSTVQRYLSRHGPLLLKQTAAMKAARCAIHHWHGRELSGIIAPETIDYSFMTVRHPIDRMVSEYNYGKTKKRRWSSLPFSFWLRLSLFRTKTKPFYRDNHFRPQHEFESFSAEIFRLEDGLGPCFRRLNELFGLAEDHDTTRVNASTPNGVRISRQDVDLIYDYYRPDFDRYGYDRSNFRYAHLLA